MDNPIKCTIDRKVARHYGICTIVDIYATMSLPPHVPDKIREWMENHPIVQGDIGTKAARLYVSRKVGQSKEDAYDKEKEIRIAESRTKKSLHRFCYTLCRKLADHYQSMVGVYGNSLHRFLNLYEAECEHYNKVITNEPDRQNT